MSVKTVFRLAGFMLSLVGGFFIFCETSLAQKRYGGAGYFMVGGKLIPLKEANTLLTSKGYPEMKGFMVSIGGGGHSELGRFIIGGEGGSIVSGGEGTNEKFHTSFSAGYGFLNVGYMVYSTKNVSIYPMLGIGGGGVSIEVRERGKYPATFEEGLNQENLQRNTVFSRGSLIIKASVGGDYTIGFGGGAGGFVTGLRVGYVFPVISSKWGVGDKDVTGGPGVSLSGLHFEVVLGWSALSLEE